VSGCPTAKALLDAKLAEEALSLANEISLQDFTNEEQI
jgi:hypothetical protein